MLLKIFTKIQKDGTPVKTGEEWKTKYYEADEVYVNMPETGKSIASFKTVFKDEEWTSGNIDLDLQGYELTNAQGIIIDRYISKKNL